MGLFDLKTPEPKEPSSEPGKNKAPKTEFENTLEGKSAAKLARYEALQTAKVGKLEADLKITVPGEEACVWTTRE